MTSATLVRKIDKLSERIIVKKEPSVLLPFSLWEEIQDKLEDFEAFSSVGYGKKMERAKKEIKEGKVAPFDMVVGK